MRPEGVAILFMIFVAAVVLLGFGLAAMRMRQLNDAFEDAARRLGGRLLPAGLFGLPQIVFYYDGVRGDVDIHSTGGKHPTFYTQVHLRWNLPGFRCEIYPEGFWQRVGKNMLGMQDIEIGSPAFDDAYFISADDPAMVREVLNAAVQSVIHRLRVLRGNNHIYVAFRGHELLVKKLGLIDDSDGLERLARLSAELYACAQAQQNVGIQFVAADAVTAVSAPPVAAVCQICGEKTVDDVVLCHSCETPHHRDCWEYIGACSTYGCQERRYILSGKKRSKTNSNR